MGSLDSDIPRVRRASASDAAALSELFKRADVPCFCQYYQFDGDHRDWQNRCANETSKNAQQLFSDIEEERIFGVISEAENQVIGWARVARPAHMAKLYENRLYRSLEVLSTGDRSRTFAMSCFLVDPAHRRKGVARALLGSAVQLAESMGADCIEAFPRGASDVSDAEQWTGPLSLYEELEFQRIVDFAPYPVYRKRLSGQP